MARFFFYLIATLRTFLPGVGNEAQTMLELPAANLEEVVTLLSNDLANAPDPFVLTLDDSTLSPTPRCTRP